jgi:hypothetical protein
MTANILHWTMYMVVCFLQWVTKDNQIISFEL